MKEFLKLIIYKLNILKVFYICFYIFPINEKKVIFSNFDGKAYGESPKAIAEELKNKKYKLIWIYSGKEKDKFPTYISVVRPYTIKYFYHLATSKFWIFNTRKKYFLKKRRKQIYIQTWHGCIALKKIEYDVYDKLPLKYRLGMKSDSNSIDLFVSSNSVFSNLCRTTFKYNGEILECGTPKNDLLVKNLQNVEKYKNKLHEILKINDNKKILFYAPTFRKDYKNDPYDIKFDNVLKILNKNKEEWIILIKFHPNIDEIEKYKYSNSNIKILKDIELDISELILASDIIVTDYSSIMFDAMIASKKVILYIKDYINYIDERGTYFKFNELPFLIAKNNKEFICKIENLKNSCADLFKYDDFKANISLNESGNASKKVVDYMDQIVKEKNGK